MVEAAIEEVLVAQETETQEGLMEEEIRVVDLAEEIPGEQK